MFLSIVTVRDTCITPCTSVLPSPTEAHFPSQLSHPHCLCVGCPHGVSHPLWPPHPGGGGPLPSQEGKQEGSLYPVFTLTRFDSMLEAALFICIIGLAGGHCWVHEVLSGRPVVQAEPQAQAVARRKQLSCWRAAGQELRGPSQVGVPGSSPVST